MPLYEYECSNCGHCLEAMQKLSEAPLRKCPACGKAQLKRLISAPVFRLKGSGWYETDFKSEKEDKRNLAERPEGEKKESAQPAAKETGEPAKAAQSESSTEKPPEKPAEKPAKTIVPAPSKKIDVGGAKRAAAARSNPPRTAKPAARPKQAAKRATKSARRR